jgi:2-haloacid dehalogenase
MINQPSIYVFDAYGTLFDVHSAAARQKEAIGPNWERLSQTWRTKHLEYTWIHAQTGRHCTFWTLTERSLDYAIELVGGVPAGVRGQLLDAYRTLSAFPDVEAVLRTLKGQGARLAILSNGDLDMLADAVKAARFEGVFDAVFSVATAGVFKPAMLVYKLSTDHFNCAPRDITFLSSNRWDAAGAAVFGHQTVWVNRSGAPDEYPDTPSDRVLRDLRPLIAT